MIPKILHYVWVGGKPMPERVLQDIASWRRFCPDYEVKLWNEKNFDVNNVPFTRDSCKLGKYGWPADYIRFWALWHYGGVYLDADVEALKNIDELLENEAFIGFENPTLVGTAIIGAEKHNPIIGALLEKFASTPFVNPDGSCYSQNSIAVVSKLLEEKFEVKMDNTLTKYEHIITYPKSLFYPHDDSSITPEHFFIHRLMCSWLEPCNNEALSVAPPALPPPAVYKPSFYNHFIPYKDSFIYHNALQGGTFVLSYPEHRQMQQLFALPVLFNARFFSNIVAFFYHLFAQLRIRGKGRKVALYSRIRQYKFCLLGKLLRREALRCTQLFSPPPFSPIRLRKCTKSLGSQGNLCSKNRPPQKY
jgi:hypothetical protein